MTWWMLIKLVSHLSGLIQTSPECQMFLGIFLIFDLLLIVSLIVPLKIFVKHRSPFVRNKLGAVNINGGIICDT